MKLSDHLQGVIEEIFIASRAGEAMQKVEVVAAVADQGLVGDRYFNGSGRWSSTGPCQVTLIEGETLDQVGAEGRVQAHQGRHRRNLVTRGIRLQELVGRRFEVGEAVLEYDRPRPPCGYLESLTQPGMVAALQGERAGICSRVVRSGRVRVGDIVRVI